MEYQEVDVREPKIAFLLANLFKCLVKNPKRQNLPELEKQYSKIKSQFSSYTEKNLDSKFKDPVRLERYNSMNWYKGQMDLEKIGVWPEMKGLAIELTIGNVPETAEHVRKALEGKLNGKVPGKFLDKLKSMENISEFIYNNFPLIVFPGGEIREKDHNRWIRVNNLIYPECKIYEVDIDDGCSRAVFYALNGIKEAPVYRGKHK
ncbi:MAG TPA: hypothetical protein PK357_00700 [Candidatus Pacearchaeota archaeon]|nr:hypothetical protein [Candidatus Pacearchaeota archaeon]